MPSARALRLSSALTICGCLVELLVALASRRVLVAGALLACCVSVHALSWAAELSIAAQSGGLLCLFPRRLTTVLQQASLLDVINALHERVREIQRLACAPPARLNEKHTSPLVRARTLATLAILPREGQSSALELLPPDLRYTVRAPLIEALLPSGLGMLMMPWADGPDELRLRRGTVVRRLPLPPLWSSSPPIQPAIRSHMLLVHSVA